MNHPPPPPDSPFFGYSNGRWFFDVSWAKEWFWLDKAVEDDVRPIIASVARCAWLDEAERLMARHDFQNARPWLDATMNAYAWRKWGECVS